MQSALQRTEAGELFKIADKPDCSCVRDDPWLIRVVSAEISEEKSIEEDAVFDKVSKEIVEKMRTGLNFVYPEGAAITIPSKLTATQLKGRIKDQEAAEFTGSEHVAQTQFRSLLERKTTSGGTEYGTALHNVMQYLDFKKCSDYGGIVNDIDRMVQRGLITKEQGRIIDIEQITAFFRSDLGKRMIDGKQVLREFKFSILEDASTYYSGVEHDRILLQGVIDCALVEDDGITVLDFKTDRITSDNRQERVLQYSRQVDTYVKALTRIYELPVKNAYIYFFSTGELVEI